MKCHLRRSRGRIFTHWTCLYSSIVLVEHNIVSGMNASKTLTPYKPEKNCTQT